MCAAQTLRSDLQLGAVYIRVMQESTEDITAPWLLPEMVSRVADMLNYFLDHLAGAPPVNPWRLLLRKGRVALRWSWRTCPQLCCQHDVGL